MAISYKKKKVKLRRRLAHCLHVQNRCWRHAHCHILCLAQFLILQNAQYFYANTQTYSMSTQYLLCNTCIYLRSLKADFYVCVCVCVWCLGRELSIKITEYVIHIYLRFSTLDIASYTHVLFCHTLRIHTISLKKAYVFCSRILR